MKPVLNGSPLLLQAGAPLRAKDRTSLQCVCVCVCVCVNGLRVETAQTGKP